MTETLSDKRYAGLCYFEEDVKQFIKDLKEEFGFNKRYTWEEIAFRIDKIFGEELTK